MTNNFLWTFSVGAKKFFGAKFFLVIKGYLRKKIVDDIFLVQQIFLVKGRKVGR